MSNARGNSLAIKIFKHWDVRPKGEKIIVSLKKLQFLWTLWGLS
jgi:hypothetical protein